jgi:uncharacterized protein
MNMHVQISEEDLKAVCRKHNISRLSFFGSVLGKEYGPESDIDVLVELENGTKTGFFRFAHIQRELTCLFGGRKVDLRTPNELSTYFRDQVMATMQVQYALESNK